jgi:hypothetical protein
MRPAVIHPMLRDVLRESHRELTSLLLAAAMLSPIAAAVLGWRVYTPLAMPLLMHETLLVAIALVAFGIGDRDDATFAARWVGRLLLVPPVAVGFAAIVHSRANVFYTERALVDGMTLLFVLQIGVSLLRRRALRRLGLYVAEPETSKRRRRGAEWRRRFRVRCLPATPGVRVSDALVAVVGWLLLAAWVLIGLEHRHPAGPMLLAAGVIEILALLALVPDVLAGTGWLAPEPRQTSPPSADGAGHLALMRDDTHAPSTVVPTTSRRHS